MTARMHQLHNDLTGPAQAHSTAETLDSLWARAEFFGHVRIYSSNSDAKEKSYHATITFPTIAGTSLEAESSFGLPLKAALQQAIDKAEQIRAHFK